MRNLNSVIREYFYLAEELAYQFRLNEIQHIAFDTLSTAMDRLDISTHSDVTDLYLHDAVKIIHTLARRPMAELPEFKTLRRPLGWSPEQAEQVRQRVVAKKQKRREKHLTSDH